MKATKKLLCMALAMTTIGTSAVHAQRVTYNHDTSKKNQVTVMELGSGSLTPELYYTLLHRNYKKSAAQKNKQSFRTTASIALYNQVDEAEAIDSALTARAKIEALNVTDRTVDVAWLAEGSKINSKMDDFQKNIDRIISAGGDFYEKQRWTEYYNVFQCAIKSTKEAYMPNAQRKRMYLSIYKDVYAQNEILIKRLVQMNNAAKTKELLAVNGTYRTANKQSIAGEARSRWKEVGERTNGGTKTEQSQ